MKIFLAEDNTDNHMVIKSNLRKVEMPYELIWAQNGKLAIEMLENEDHIDIFLIDIEMPYIGGVELTQWIRSQGRFKKTPVVAITASVFAEMKQMYLEQGFDTVLEKPFERKELLSLLHETVQLS